MVFGVEHGEAQFAVGEAGQLPDRQAVAQRDRERAAQLKGMEIAVPRSAFPPPAEGEYYWADLVDCQVVNVGGEVLAEALEGKQRDANASSGPLGRMLATAKQEWRAVTEMNDPRGIYARLPWNLALP